MIKNIYNNSNFYTKIKLPSLFSKRYLIRWQPKHRTKLHNHNNMMDRILFGLRRSRSTFVEIVTTSYFI